MCNGPNDWYESVPRELSWKKNIQTKIQCVLIFKILGLGRTPNASISLEACLKFNRTTINDKFLFFAAYFFNLPIIGISS